MQALLQRVADWFNRKPLPPHLQAGRLGEKTAKQYLKRQGLKFLTANFRTPRGEVDLICRDGDCLQFVHI